jgi:hypothetical protein
MNTRIIWCPLLGAILLTGCKQQTSSSSKAEEVPALPAEHIAIAIPDQPVQGTVLGSPFVADQIIVSDDRITFRHGKEFFADRDVAISVFPGTLPIEANDVAKNPVVHSGTITLSEMKPSENLPTHTEASTYKLSLVFGPREPLGVPVQINLETSGKDATRIVGRGFATFDDIRVVGHQVDLRWDTLDTLRHVAKEYVRRTQTSKDVVFEHDFGVTMRDPGTATEPKTAFVGYEISVAGAPTSLMKLQLQKDESGWRVADALSSDQIDDAHPLNARTSPEASAGQMLEMKLQHEQLMPSVRGTNVSCRVSAEGGHGSCDTRYQLSQASGRNCHLQNYRMAYRDKRWVVVGEIAPEERVDVTTGAIVKQTPSMFGCG